MVWHTWGQATRRPELAPLVLLHGGSGSWMHWLRNIPALAAQAAGCWCPTFRVSAIRRRRCSGTDADVLPEPVEQGLAMLAGDSACDLVGFSFGGMVAGFLAQRFPARAARVVLVGAPGLGVAREKALRLRAWRHITDAASAT
jgi:2-hydroxy-6-oxonona-2,4-dienedioate hydrolase